MHDKPKLLTRYVCDICGKESIATNEFIDAVDMDVQLIPYMNRKPSDWVDVGKLGDACLECFNELQGFTRSA